MALTPGEAQRPSEAEIVAADRLEAQIDEAILNRHPGTNGEYWINVSLGGFRIKAEVLDRYRKAGWRTRIEHDQREGDYLILWPMENPDASA
jgi:hypothetical protein